MGKLQGFVSSFHHHTHAKQQPSQSGSACGSPKHSGAGSPLTAHKELLLQTQGPPLSRPDDEFSMPSAIVSRLAAQPDAKASPRAAALHAAPLDAAGGAQQVAAAAQQQQQQQQQQAGAALHYSQLARRMVAMVNELRATGADVVLQLPTIVVAGQQSAGKSSLVENICGILLPRAADCCTRCPTEVRLSQAAPSSGAAWEATVKLRRDAHAGGGAAPGGWLAAAQQPAGGDRVAALASGGRPASAPLLPHSPSAGARQAGRYPQLPSEVDGEAAAAPEACGSGSGGGGSGASSSGSLETVFRAGITNADELPAVVAAAQAALLTRGGPGDGARRASKQSSSLSPSSVGGAAAATEAAVASDSRAASDLSAAAAGPGAALKFSRDVVVVEVAGAQTDLTLIDLPGLIQNVERPSDQHYQVLVTELTRTYMEQPASVIVCCLTCTADAACQGVLSMAREADPRGERTIGVLTKPDQVEEGCHRQWLAVLEGSRYPLALKWFAVRNPNQAALLRGTSSAAARQQEDLFFDSTPPWNRLPLEQRTRLGTPRLREAMSRQLAKMAAAARPALMAAAQGQLVALRTELAALPPATVLGDSHAEMLRLIDDVSIAIQDEVLARGPSSASKAFFQHIVGLFQVLKSRLAASRPCFLLRRAVSSAASCVAVTVALDDDLQHDDVQPRLQQQQQLASAGSFSSSGGGAGPHVSRPGSFDIFGGASVASAQAGVPAASSTAGSGKPALGVFLAGGSGSSGVPPGSAGAAMVLAAVPHQVLLPPDSPEALAGLTLDDVRQLVEQHHSNELPGYLPYSAVLDLVSRHQTTWAAAACDCVSAAHLRLQALVLGHVARAFERFPAAAEHVSGLACSLLEELHSEASAAVKGLVAMELGGNLLAVSRREFARQSAQHLEGLRTLLAAAGAAGPGPAAAPASEACLAGGAQAEAAPVIPATATGPSELLSMMAACLTYYGLAARRTADTISLAIMHHLLTSFNARFRACLASGLLGLPSTSVAAMLVEDEACAAHRAALTARRDLLEQAMAVMRAAL